MNIRYVVSLAIVAAMLTITAPVSAQSPSTAEQVKTWSQKKWNQARAEFAKDKAKWASCRQQSADKKLKGRASWSFLYDCMKA
jgi:hypothetical protein